MKTPWVAAATFCLGVAAGYGLFRTGAPVPTITRHPEPVSMRPLDTLRVVIPAVGRYQRNVGTSLRDVGLTANALTQRAKGTSLHEAAFCYELRSGETFQSNDSSRASPDLPAIVASWLDDTLVVDLPRQQFVYEGENYTAWVSGVAPALDSIAVRTPKLSQPRRWSVAVQAGMGITPAGPQPYIGLGLSFSLTRR